MAVLRLSFTNLAAGAAASASASAQTCEFCSSEAQAPQRPFRPWRTPTTTTTAEWLLDLGSSQTLDVVALVNANFTSATIQGASSSGLFAAPGYNEAVALTRDALTQRFQHTHITTGFGYRWLRVKLDACSQAGTGATSTYFSLGGLWAGALTSAPTHLQADATLRTILPRLDVGPSHGGWTQRLKQGEPRAQIRGTLSAGITPTTPLLNDDADTWASLFRQWWTADYAFVFLNLNNTRQGYLFRSVDDIEYRLDGTRALVSVNLEEVVGP